MATCWFFEIEFLGFSLDGSTQYHGRKSVVTSSGNMESAELMGLCLDLLLSFSCGISFKLALSLAFALQWLLAFCYSRWQDIPFDKF